MPDPAGSVGVAGAPSRILLVGFMASGKSAVGREVARLLDWPFRDFDEEIRRQTGQEVAHIFRDAGEAAFRATEARVARRLLSCNKVVLASGGGWACQPGHMAGLPGGTLAVWLKVTPQTAVERARAQGVERPLLDGAHPVERARRLLAERQSYYRLARLTLDSEGVSVSTLARLIVRFPSGRDQPAPARPRNPSGTTSQ